MVRARCAGRANHARQLVVERPGWSLRPRFGDIRLDRCRPTPGHARHGPALDGAVEPRDDALPAAPRWPSRTAAAVQRGHRNGPGAAADGAGGPAVGVRDGYLPALAEHAPRLVA